MKYFDSSMGRFILSVFMDVLGRGSIFILTLVKKDIVYSSILQDGMNFKIVYLLIKRSENRYDNIGSLCC